MPIGDRIRQIRRDTGLSQSKFAERIRISFGSVSKLERSETNPADRTIALICSEFGVNEAWLRTGEGEPYPPPEAVTLDSLVSGAGLDGHEADFARKFLRMFRLLRPDTRQDIMERFDEIFGGPQSAGGKPATVPAPAPVPKMEPTAKPWDEMTREEKIAEFTRQLDEEEATNGEKSQPGGVAAG